MPKYRELGLMYHIRILIKKMPKIVLSHVLIGSTMQPSLQGCLPLSTRSSSIYPKSIEKQERETTVFHVAFIYCKNRQGSMVLSGSWGYKTSFFLKFQLAVTFPSSHLLSCVYFIFMNKTAELQSACAILQLLFWEKCTWQLEQQLNNSKQSF